MPPKASARKRCASTLKASEVIRIAIEEIARWMPKVSVKLKRWWCVMIERMKAPWGEPFFWLAYRRSATSLSSSSALLAVAKMTSIRTQMLVKIISYSILSIPAVSGQRSAVAFFWLKADR